MADITTIINNLNLLHPDGSIRNLRVLRGGMQSSFYRSTEKLAQEVVDIDSDESVKAIYVQMQAVATIDDIPASGGVRRTNMGRYLSFCVDVDTERPDKARSNATNTEKAASWSIVKAVHKYLRSEGWPSAIIADSGNGWHLEWHIDLPFDTSLDKNDPNFILLKNCLRALALLFNTPSGEVDTSMAEPEQLIKLWGTMVRKGPHSEARPWRRSAVLRVPETVELVPVQLLQKLAAQVPAPVAAKPRATAKNKGPRTVETFDVEDFMEHYELCRHEYMDDYHRDGLLYIPLSQCPMAERAHGKDKGDETCLVLGNHTLGFSCLNEAECGHYTIGDVIRKLNEEYEHYPQRIWDEPPMDDVEFDDATEVTGEAKQEVEQPEPVPMHTSVFQETGQTLRTDPVVELDWVQQLACVIFREHKACFLDYAIWRQRLLKIVKSKAWPKDKLPLLKAITEFELGSKRLPTKEELLDVHKADFEVVGLVQHLEPTANAFTLDYVIENLVRQAQYLDEKRTATKYLDTLTKIKDIVKSRSWVKQRWQDSITLVERRVQEGSVQDNAEAIYERFRRMQQGMTEEELRASLRFKSGFRSIDDTINSDLERCFAIAGPPNNFKTTVLLSLVNNLGRQGKSVLLVTGEHDPQMLEESMVLLQGYHLRSELSTPLPTYKEFRDSKATEEQMAALRFVVDDVAALRDCPGPIVVKQINDFHNDLDEIVQYMESTHAKYEWQALVIDPFDCLLLNTEANQRFFKGGELVQKLFDLKTSYRDGQGLIVLTSLQMKKSVKKAVEQLQHEDGGATRADLRDVLDASEIETHSAAVQKFDMIWGVAAQDDTGSRGVLVCSRVRFGQPFEPFTFTVDASSHYCYQKPKMSWAPPPEPPTQIVDITSIIEGIE